jgi:hypothetical protein
MQTQIEAQSAGYDAEQPEVNPVNEAAALNLGNEANGNCLHPRPNDSHAASATDDQAPDIGSLAGTAPAGFEWIAEVEPWGKQVEGKELLNDLASVLSRFVVLPKWAAETLALWTLHTYAFQLRDVTAYVGIESPEKRCGKTTLLTVLSELVNRPVVAANISSPAFFRVIEEARPTLLIDEADTLLTGNDELRGILNAGYSRKTAFVVRVGQAANCEPRIGSRGEEGHLSDPVVADPAEAAEGLAALSAPTTPERGPATRLARYSCWCPKVIAAIGRLPETLADRCIVIRMQRKTTRELCERLRNLETTVLRRKCARFVADHASKIADARPEIPASLNDRAADIWEPLLALADLAGGEWPARARDAAVGLTASSQESHPISSLLLDIMILFVQSALAEQKARVEPTTGPAAAGRLFSRELVEGLNASNQRPWAELTRGKPITDMWLARQLRPYGVQPRTLRRDEIRAKGYFEEDFREAFARYIPRSELQALVEDMKG